MLFLVRHGQTAANASGLLLGRADPPLSPLGREQAAALAGCIPAGTRVVSSPAARTRETAAALGSDFEIDERWIELDYGDLDQVPLRDVPPAVWAQWRADPTFIPAGGESLATLGVHVPRVVQRVAGRDPRVERRRGDARVADQGGDRVGARGR